MLTKHKLGELLEVTRGMSLPGENYSESGELIRLTMGNFNYTGGGFKENTSKSDIYYIGEVKPEYILKKGDIITPLTEQAIGLLGTTAMIPESGKYIQSQDVALVIPDESKLDRLFCYYLVSSDIVKKQLSAAAQQTKIRHTSPDKIKDCTVWIPELPIQNIIGKILYDIDKKIAINTRINAELEAMAKQLYDYWFVQFDFPDENGKPYKSSGGKMVYNTTLKREIPAGWEVKTVKDYAKIFTGKKDVSKVIPGDYLFFSCAPAPITSNEYIYDGEVVLVSGNGSYTGRVTYYNGKCDLYQRTYGCILKIEFAEFYPWFYCYMKYYFEPLYKGGKHGSAIPYIVLSDLEDSVIVSNNKIIRLFCSKFKSIFEYRFRCQYKNVAYPEQLRDFLLPILMNGQVIVE